MESDHRRGNSIYPVPQLSTARVLGFSRAVYVVRALVTDLRLSITESLSCLARSAILLQRWRSPYKQLGLGRDEL